MKKIYTLILLLLLVASASAQIEMSHVSIQKQEDMLNVRFTANIGKKTTKQNYKLILTPVLYNKDKSQRIKQIIIETRNSRIIDARNGIAPTKEAYLAENRSKIDYSFTFPYEKWMNGSALRLDQLSCGCCTENILQPILIADNLLLVKDRVPVIENRIVYTPRIEQVARKWLFTKKDMIIDFRLSKTEIIDSLFENRQTLKDIVEAVEKVRKQTNTVLNKVEIMGYASPEGRESQNADLAKNRAIALKDYLQDKIPGLPDNVFTLQNGGENWQGLRRMVIESGMQYKEEVLHIIDNVPVEVANESHRKKQLMNLRGGHPYRYLSKELYPKLRNACYIAVYYDTLSDTVADTINEALALIGQKGYTAALDKLTSVEDDSRAYNAIGVCYMMLDKEDEAKRWFEKAIASGDKEAIENMKQIQK